ncbi:MAG: hypothetical protein AAFX53_08325 [Bacteroidota bacterium]
MKSRIIAFLHTSDVHIPRFEKLVRKYDKEVVTKHFVNKELLNTALLEGKTDTLSFNQEVEKIKREEPSLLICTCSTYGAECENHNDIERIDRPVVEYLVARYNTIGLAYTAHSTKAVSEDLISKVASGQKRKTAIVPCDCSQSWPYFEQGNHTAYWKAIADKIKSVHSRVDVIFLAQASMEGAKEYLTTIEKEVFSSPEFGISAFLNQR